VKDLIEILSGMFLCLMICFPLLRCQTAHMSFANFDCSFFLFAINELSFFFFATGLFFFSPGDP